MFCLHCHQGSEFMAPDISSFGNESDINIIQKGEPPAEAWRVTSIVEQHLMRVAQRLGDLAAKREPDQPNAWRSDMVY